MSSRVLRAHRDFVNSWTIHIATDSDELHAESAVRSLRLEPLRSAGEDHGGERKGLNVVDGGRLVPKSIRSREGRLVARFGAFAFDRFEQRALFAADVAAGADKNFEVEGQSAAQNTRAEKPFAVTTVDLFLQNFSWVARTRAGCKEFRGGRP